MDYKFVNKIFFCEKYFQQIGIQWTFSVGIINLLTHCNYLGFSPKSLLNNFLMANLLDLIKSQLSDGVRDQISNQLGADRKKTDAATDNILATLIEGLAKNTQQKGGADALANALEKDHDGSLLDNLHDIIGGKAEQAVPAQQKRAINGAGILKHILGGNQSGIADMIGKLSGLDSGKTGNLMTILAPIVMQMLGKQKREANLDTGGLASILANTVGSVRKNPKTQGGGLLKMFLDKNGDGSIVDDVAGMVIGRLFGRK